MKQQDQKSASTEHEAVYHAARCCQAASLSLTASRLRGLKWTCSLESKKTAGFFAAHRSEGAVGMHHVDLGCESGMSALGRLKNRRVVVGMVDPHRVDDAQPDIGQSSYGHGMTFAFCSLALVVGQRAIRSCKVDCQAN